MSADDAVSGGDACDDIAVELGQALEAEPHGDVHGVQPNSARQQQHRMGCGSTSSMAQGAAQTDTAKRDIPLPSFGQVKMVCCAFD